MTKYLDIFSKKKNQKSNNFLKMYYFKSLADPPIRFVFLENRSVAIEVTIDYY